MAFGKQTIGTHEAAKILGIAQQSVVRLIRQGKIEAEQVSKGASWQIALDSLLSYASSERKRGRPPRQLRRFFLMNKDYKVALISYDGERTVKFSVDEVYDENRCPPYTIVSQKDTGPSILLDEWWNNRNIPVSRHGLDRKLRELGIGTTYELPFVSLGLSLSDQYWLCPSDQDIAWKDVNFFDNVFENSTVDDNWGTDWTWGIGSYSPDNVLNGYLPKKWICRNEMRLLMKGSAEALIQAPYNEVAASRILSRLLNPTDFVEYRLERVGNDVASICPCFASRNEEFIPMFQLVNRVRAAGDENRTLYDKVLKRMTRFGIPENDAITALSKMIVCDFLIANTDRHLNNFGIIRNVDTLKCRPAPLFDFGNSMWLTTTTDSLLAGNYDFRSKPFDSNPDNQLSYAKNRSWLDLSLLDGIEEELDEIFSAVPEWDKRSSAISRGVRQQIERVRQYR